MEALWRQVLDEQTSCIGEGVSISQRDVKEDKGGNITKADMYCCYHTSFRASISQPAANRVKTAELQSPNPHASVPSTAITRLKTSVCIVHYCRIYCVWIKFRQLSLRRWPAKWSTFLKAESQKPVRGFAPSVTVYGKPSLLVTVHSFFYVPCLEVVWYWSGFTLTGSTNFHINITHKIEQIDWWEVSGIPSGLGLGWSEMLRSLRHYLWA